MPVSASDTEVFSSISGRGRLSIVSNALWASVGNVVGAGAMWGLVVLLARFQSAEVVGRYSLALAIASPVFLLFNMHLRTLQATDSLQTYQFAEYFAFRAVTTTGALAFCATLPAVLGLSGETAPMLTAVGVSKACESLSEIIYGRMQQQERMDVVAKSMMLRGALSLLGMAALLRGGAGGLAGVWAATAASLAVLAAYDLRIAAGERPRPWQGVSLARLVTRCRSLAAQAGPLSVLVVMVSLNLNTPRYWLARFGSEHDVGVFSAVAFLTIAGTTLVMAAGQAAGPRMASYFASGDLRRYLAHAAGLSGIGLALGLAGIGVAWIGGEKVLGLLYGKQYSGYSGLFLELMVAGGFGYLASCSGYILASARRFGIQIPILALATAATAGSGLWLVPARGLHGAAASQALGNAVQAAVSAVVIASVVRGKSRRGGGDCDKSIH